MDSNKKIDLINAYRQLSGTALKLSKGTAEEAASAVQEEFRLFVSSRIEALLSGESKDDKPTGSAPANQLTEDDVQVLLALIENVRSKQRLNEAANAPLPQAQRNIQSQQQVRGGSTNARPIRDNDPTGEKYRSANESLLNRLAKMEKQGPEF